MDCISVSCCDGDFGLDTTVVAAPDASDLRRIRPRQMSGSDQQQRPLPQPHPSLTTEIGRGRFGIAGRSRGIVAGFVARMIAPWSPSPTAWVDTTSISVRPTAARPARYSPNDNAP